MKEVIVTVERGKGDREKYLYAKCVEVGSNHTVISATLKYVLEACRDRGYRIVNAQQVLNFIVADKLLRQYLG